MRRGLIQSKFWSDEFLWKCQSNTEIYLWQGLILQQTLEIGKVGEGLAKEIMWIFILTWNQNCILYWGADVQKELGVSIQPEVIFACTTHTTTDQWKPPPAPRPHLHPKYPLQPLLSLGNVKQTQDATHTKGEPCLPEDQAPDGSIVRGQKPSKLLYSRRLDIYKKRRARDTALRTDLLLSGNVNASFCKILSQQIQCKWEHRLLFKESQNVYSFATRCIV